MPRVTISVVIPVKDDAEALERCLRALLSQTRQAEEIIVVDDGSSDGSASVARAYGATVVPSVGTGIPAASATGYDAATSEVCARLDADCVPPSGWLERIAERFEDPTLDGLTGFARFHDGPRPLRVVLAYAYLGAYIGSLYPALGHVPLFGSNMAIRHTAWREARSSVHRSDTLVHDDLDLSFHLGPVRQIRLDTRLPMTMSMRPFSDPRALLLRLRRGFHSVIVHWPGELPWLRWYRRATIRRSLRNQGGAENRLA